jgi:uncharacterized protein
MKIFAISDIHGATKPLELASAEISAADLVIISGDISRTGTAEDASSVIQIIEQLNRNILAVHGNMDRDEVRLFLEEKGYSLHAAGRVIGETGFFGVGGSRKTPFRTRCEYSEEQISAFLQAGYRGLNAINNTVLVSHTPPYGTCDRSFLGNRGGSKSVTEFILNHPVDLCISGHIHEAAGVEMLGRTVVANTGSLKSGNYHSITIGPAVRVEPRAVGAPLKDATIT